MKKNDKTQIAPRKVAEKKKHIAIRESVFNSLRQVAGPRKTFKIGDLVEQLIVNHLEKVNQREIEKSVENALKDWKNHLEVV